jgi:hypothetical protein
MTKAYAIAVAVFLRWCQRTGRDWRTAAADLGLFMVWLKFTPADPDAGPVVPGPGAAPVRGERRINRILCGVRGFLAFAATHGEAPLWVVGQIYEVADARRTPTGPCRPTAISPAP